MSRIADLDLSGLPVRVHYPDSGDGPWPVILFSHGLGGSRLGYGYLGRAWADRGYVSIHPSHAESVGLKLPVPVEDVEISQGAARLETLRAMKQAIDDPRNWEARPHDLAHVISNLEAFPLEAVRGKLDGSRIGIAGHSFGGYTALLCAGARLLSDGQLRDFSEPRAKAFIAMSPPGNGSRGLGPWSWPHVRPPVLCLTGTRDGSLQGQPVEWRFESFEGMPPGDKTLIVLSGAEHFTFSGGRPRRKADPAHLVQIEAATLWFWNRYLRGVQSDPPALEGARITSK